MQVTLHDAHAEPEDVWAVFKPSVQKFIYQDGNPYGRGNAIRYDWIDGRVGLELTIEVWRQSDGVHARKVS